MVDSCGHSHTHPSEIYRVDAKLGEELAYVEKRYRDYAISLVRRVAELNLPSDMKEIILREASKVTQDGIHAANKKENTLWQQWKQEYYEDDLEGLEG